MTDVTEGQDGLVRRVKMHSRNKQVVRPVIKMLYSLMDLANKSRPSVHFAFIYLLIFVTLE